MALCPLDPLSLCVDIGVSANLELVDKFYYLGDMLSVDGDADADVKTRIGIRRNHSQTHRHTHTTILRPSWTLSGTRGHHLRYCFRN